MKYHSDEQIVSYIKSLEVVVGCTGVGVMSNGIERMEESLLRCKDCKCFMEFRDSVKEEEGADGTCYRLVMHCFDHDFALVNATDYCSWGVKRNEND